MSSRSLKLSHGYLFLFKGMRGTSKCLLIELVYSGPVGIFCGILARVWLIAPPPPIFSYQLLIRPFLSSPFLLVALPLKPVFPEL